jgi:hypothetical protein
MKWQTFDAKYFLCLYRDISEVYIRIDEDWHTIRAEIFTQSIIEDTGISQSEEMKC